MSESVILCEGFHDRAFWDGWLTWLGCNSDGFKPGTPGYPALDPFGKAVIRGEFGYRSKSGGFIRIRACGGKSGVLPRARLRLTERTTNALERLVINIDADSTASGATVASTGLQRANVEQLARTFDPSAVVNADGEIELDGGATKISLIRWEVSDPPAPGLPDQQTLERLVCAVLAAAYPGRATSVQSWLDSRPGPPGVDPKEHGWSYMAGWYAEHGCEAFYSNQWNDPAVVAELTSRLQSSGAWQIAAMLAG
jgi:hypothetical protein